MISKIINSIDTLCDLNLNNINSSLTWSEVVQTLLSEFGNVTATPPVILTISVIFVSPTAGVKPVVIKFNYLTSISLL